MNYIKITIKIKDKPPFFMGSQIRGAFGVALKKIVCLNPPNKHGVCILKENCLYCAFFEIKNTISTYRLDFKLGAREYDFNVYLFNRATKELAYVLSALLEMLKNIGLGKEKKTYEDFSMLINDTNCLNGEEISLPKNSQQIFSIKERFENIILELVTPLRIKKDNRFLRDAKNLELKDLINSIYQRQMKLLNRDFKKFPYEIKGEIIERDLKYLELTRSSNRQKTTMQFGGLVGKLKIKGLNKESFEVLKLGELIGVGKSCVFGLGKIEVKGLE
ncbi:CRISPR system precrRNA processing endoribonuclease RAMP protein Cas6 [Helicobacter cetorum]|uniref:CRISPR system precrRNA processing endoribonuclease RAMP protein Cas6 n=1 Tax=Helicobacter cetorum TaxID=138563 RepID=UPI000CF11EF9|nr:CRISPR system precrRNA processing endoribonuclease RAMP protein Cas6 [Helicobacter cetorum]